MRALRIGIAGAISFLCLGLSLIVSSCSENPVRFQNRAPSSELNVSVQESLDHFSQTLMATQQEDGEWSGSFAADPTMDAIPIIFSVQMGIHDSKVEKESADRIFSQQDPVSHLWLKFPSGPPSIETTGIILYALELIGISKDDPRVATAWDWFNQNHGFKKMNLAAQLIALTTEKISEKEIPFINHLTTEFFSKNGKFSLIGIGSWKDMFVPYLVWNFYRSAAANHTKVSALDPARLGSAGRLFGTKITPAEFSSKKEFWAQEGLGWLLEHQQADGSWCGYIPCVLYSSLALKAATDAHVADFSPQISRAWQSLMTRRQVLSDGTTEQLVSRKMVWDTARSLTALNALPETMRAKLPSSKMSRSIEWLLDHQIKTPGNWSTELPNTPAGGWSFQLYNEFNPDTDDTGQVVWALLNWKDSLPLRAAEIEKAATTGVEWFLDFQQKNGGFAAFTKANYKTLKTEIYLYGKLTREHMPDLFLNSDNDVTARLIAAMRVFMEAYPSSPLNARIEKSISHACSFLRKSEKVSDWAPGGVWEATWMVDYLHGTAQSIEAILHGGCETSEELASSVDWLVSVQNSSGGWGESPESYDSRRYVSAAPTLIQSEFVLEALITYEKFLWKSELKKDSRVDQAIERGINYLLVQTAGTDSPKSEGMTETFIPKVWYVNYGLQPHYELVRTLGYYLELGKLRGSSL